MSRYSISELTWSDAKDINSKYNFELCLVDHEDTEIINNVTQLKQLKQLKLTVEELFELKSVIDNKAKQLVTAEQDRLKHIIKDLEDRTEEAKGKLQEINVLSLKLL